MSLYLEILKDFNVADDKEGLAILKHMRFVHPEETEDSCRILIGILRLNFGTPSNFLKILKKYCPDDPELDEDYRSTAAKVAGYLKKLIRKSSQEED